MLLTSLCNLCIATIGLHVGSAHIAPSEDLRGTLNGVNPGAYVVLNNGFTVGGYYNSFRRNSVYAGWTFYGPKLGPFTPSIEVGGITGYSDGNKPMLAVVPSIETPIGDSGLYARVSYVPKFSYTRVHTVHLSLEWKFK